LKIFDRKTLKAWDEFTIQNKPVSSRDLMYSASVQLFSGIKKRISPNQKVVVICGSGNNGGDGLCIALLLRDHFYRTEVWYCPVSKQTEENAFYFDKVKKTDEIAIFTISPNEKLPQTDENSVFIDALMGNNFSGTWRNDWHVFINHLNHLPNEKIAIDLPSGIGDENILDNLCVRVNTTLTIETPKRCFFYRENESAIGKWEIVPIGLLPQFYHETPAKYQIIDTGLVAGKLKKRGIYDQKWAFGHAAIIAGSDTMPGAAILATKACIRSGAGLTTVYVPEKVADIIKHALPEAIFSFTGKDSTNQDIKLSEAITAYGIGPGIGRHPYTGNHVLHLLKNTTNLPKVIDADAINILAANTGSLSTFVHNAVLTPHQKEFERLFGQQENMLYAEETALEAARSLNSVIVLKGAYTRVCTPDGHLYYNTTGNPGMAKGGSGDVLTGIISGLLAQGYSPEDAAITGVYIHGLAGDLAAVNTGEISMTAGDIIDNIGKAFVELTK
jgi:hydroxyethylthiazole kinase-like uncharacterized protein yjeF